MTAPLRPVPSAGFRDSSKWLGKLDPAEAGALITNAADVALVMDKDGVIRDVAFSVDDLAREGYDQWLGRPWIDTVTIESRAKVRELLAGTADRPRFRELNHPSRHGLDVPIRYSAVRMAKSGSVIALGRDLRNISMLQQRLVEAQQAMEREYARLRLSETRYRMLFNLGSEPVVIVDGSTYRTIEANPASQRSIGGPGGLAAGTVLPSLFETESADALVSVLKSARVAGRAGDVEVRTAATRQAFKVSASLFRQDNNSFLLVRFTPQPATTTPEQPGLSAQVLEMLEKLPDGFVVVAPDFKVLEANRAFLELAEFSSKAQVLGQDFGQWFGRPGVDLPLLMASLAEHGTVRGFSTFVSGQYGGSEDVDVSAVPALNGEAPCYGFILRSTGARQAINGGRTRELSRSVEHLADLVGRVPLKDLVRETTDVIERLCIEAALELSQDNRASAAQMLGLSRQSLYAKLRRHQLGGLDDELLD